MAWVVIHLLSDPQRLRDLSIRGFVEAITIGIVANAVIGVAFSDLVCKTAPHTAFSKRIAAYYYSQIAKYMPGRIAALLVQRSILSGPNATAATIVSNLELIAVSSCLCTGAALALLCSVKSFFGATVVAIAATALGARLFRLDWRHLLQRVLGILPGSHQLLAMSTTTDKRIGRIRALILSANILVLPATSSYVLLTRGMHVDLTSASSLTALLLLSWVGGIVAFMFPAGIGVREAIFFALGGTVAYAPAPDLMAGIAVASRLVQIAVDILGTLIFLGVTQWRRLAGAAS